MPARTSGGKKTRRTCKSWCYLSVPVTCLCSALSYQVTANTIASPDRMSPSTQYLTGHNPVCDSVFNFKPILPSAIPVASSAMPPTFLSGEVSRASVVGTAVDMVNQIPGFLPNLLSASIVLAIFFLIAKLSSTLVTNLLQPTGFNKFPQHLGLASSESTGAQHRPIWPARLRWESFCLWGSARR